MHNLQNNITSSPATLVPYQPALDTVYEQIRTCQPREAGRMALAFDELFDDLESRHAGLRARLVDDNGLRRFVNVYLNDEDVRFLGGLKTEVKDGDSVTVLPAVAGG